MADQGGATPNGSSIKKGPTPEDVSRASSWKESGNESFKRGEYGSAIDSYLSASRLDPTQPSYQSNLASAYMAQRDFQAAKQACIKSLEIYGSKRHEKEREQSATSNTENDKEKDSEFELDLAESKVLLRLAKCYLSLGDLKACQSTLSRLSPNVKPSQLPGLDSIKNSLEKTLQHFDSSIKNLKAGNFTMSHIALDKAISETQSISNTSTSSTSSSTSTKNSIPLSWRILRSLIYLSQAKLDDSSSAISDALRLNPNDPEALTTRGQVLLAKGDLAKAVSHAQAALRSDPENKDARELLKRGRKLEREKEEGNTAFKGGNMDDAVQKYTSAIELCDSTSTTFSPYSLPTPELKGFKATLFSNRATSYSKLNQHSKAISDCNSALELDPNYLKALRTRARSHLQDEKYEESVRDFKKVLEEGDDTVKKELKNAEIELKKSKKKDYYKILGVQRDASSAEIKKAFRKESLIHHPDKGGDEEKFKLINEAFGILSDDDKRRRFDAGQDDLESDNPFGGGMGGFGEEVNLADLFGAGGGMGGFPGGGFGGMGGGNPFGGGPFGGSSRRPPPGFRFG